MRLYNISEKLLFMCDVIMVNTFLYVTDTKEHAIEKIPKPTLAC